MSDLTKYFCAATTTPELASELAQWRIKVQNFTKKLNASPDKSIVRVKQGTPYIPISHEETLLDELFFGQWCTSGFQYTQIANEIIGSICLDVLHPVTGIWIKREGAAAIQIMQDKGTSIESILQTKKKNALETGFPKLKAMCIKNAAISIGKAFGRDLSRKPSDVGSYKGLVINTGDWKEALEILDSYAGDDIEALRAEAIQKRAGCQLTTEYIEDLRERCNENT